MTDTPTDIPPPAEVDPNEPLVPGFSSVTQHFWRERVQRMREEKGIEGPLSRVDADGLEVQWLYGPDDALAADPAGLPDHGPFVRGSRVGTAWDIRQEHGHPAIPGANKQLLEDLNGGVTSFTLRFDDAARTASALGDPAFEAGRGRHGIAISSADDLDAVLEGVYVDLAPVSLDAGAAAIPAAALLRAVWDRRDLDLAEIRGAFGIDPLGTLATEGVVPGGIDAALAAAGRIAAETVATTPKVQALRVDTRAFVGAGATPALELAIAATIGTAYLRACVAAGLSPEQAATQIEFQLTSGQVQFDEIAKLRAFRRIWARILEASGVPEQGRRSPVYARAAERMLSRVDPWTNMLRGTTSLFGAAVGGADGATVAAFDVLISGDPSTLGRRIARNTQIILLEESGLARVADPAGGSWYVESRTDQVAKAAWAHVQRLEAEGGIVEAVTGDRLRTELAALEATRVDELVHRKRELTGVNTFPLLGDEGLEPQEPVDLEDLARRDVARRADRPAVAGLDAPSGSATLAELVALAEAGARIDELAPFAQPAITQGEPFPQSRDAEPFEALRDAADAAEQAPKILVAPLGPLAATVNIVTWVRNFFAVGGIDAVVPAIDENPVGLAESGDYTVAVLCPGKGFPDDDVAATAEALRAAGIGHVILAGGKGDRIAALGADTGVAAGIDMVSALTDLQHLLLTAKQDA